MLNKAKTLKGYKLNSLDGEIGKVKDFYFDDQHWTVRYLVAETGTWLAERQVLISPYALGPVDRADQDIVVDLTKKQIEDSPSLDSEKPVSRQFEESFHGYYDIPVYWAGPNSWGYYPYIERDRGQWKTPTKTEKAWDPHLRSTQAVSGYNIFATDGEIGHIEDFIIDDRTWTIRYLIVNTSNWWEGKKILMSPQWIDRVSWDEKAVFINVSCEAIKQSPEYTNESQVNRDYEIGLHGHYNRKGYWVDELAGKELAY